LYHRYLSENIEHPSAVFFGIDEHPIEKAKIEIKKKLLKFLNFSIFFLEK
jgi:hypothetical protein